MDWSGVDYLWIIVMFLSAVWTRSDGTHSLQRIHWWASDVMLNFSRSVLMKKQTLQLHLRWPNDEYIFRWTIPLMGENVSMCTPKKQISWIGEYAFVHTSNPKAICRMLEWKRKRWRFILLKQRMPLREVIVPKEVQRIWNKHTLWNNHLQWGKLVEWADLVCVCVCVTENWPLPSVSLGWGVNRNFTNSSNCTSTVKRQSNWKYKYRNMNTYTNVERSGVSMILLTMHMKRLRKYIKVCSCFYLSCMSVYWLCWDGPFSLRTLSTDWIWNTGNGTSETTNHNTALLQMESIRTCSNKHLIYSITITLTVLSVSPRTITGFA